MMKDRNNIPTLLKLKDILETLKDNSPRFVYIKYSHTFHNVIFTKIQDLNLQYTTIKFSDIADEKLETHPFKTKRIPEFIIRIFQYIIELFPIVALIDLLANIAFDKFNYYLKKSDYHKIKSVLGIRKKPGKYKKLNKIIIVEEVQNLKTDNIQYMQFLGYLAKAGYLPNTALLIFCDKMYDTGFQFTNAIEYDLEFTAEDFKEYTGETLESKYLLEIIESLGLEYVDTLQTIFKSGVTQQYKLMESIVNQLIENIGYNSDIYNLNKFLVICSYLFDEFKFSDLKEIDEKVITNYQSMLPVSLKAKILRNSETILYTFTEKSFKEYFINIPSIQISREDAINIIDYLKEQYPERYVDLALVSKFMPLKSSEKLSYFIMAYYHRKMQNMRYCNIIVEFLYNDPLGKVILSLDNCRGNIRECSFDDLSYKINKAIELMSVDAMLYPEAKLCILNYISDAAYEIITEQKRLQEIFEIYMKLFQRLKIFSFPDERYVDYVLDAVVFSTSIENYTVQRRVNKLLYWLEKRNFTNIENKIKFYRLGNLLYVLNINKALDFTHIAYDISENNLLLHEESRLNYSVSLIGAGKYEKAYKILKENRISSPDYQSALQNNIIISGFLAEKYSEKKVLEKFSVLKNNTNTTLTSDCCIILNNYVSALILNSCLEQNKEIEQICHRIIGSGDSYHIFFSLNNLLILYYLLQDHDNFQKVFEQLQVPYLLRKHNEMLHNKKLFLKENFFKHYSLNGLNQKFKQFEDEREYGNKFYSQPIILGLMERWFK